jgi:membrane protein
MDVRRLTKEMLDGFERNDLLTYASAISFQVLTAIVPFMLFGLGVLGFLKLGSVWRADLAPDVRNSVSHASYVVINNTVNHVIEKKQLFWLTGGFVLALWQVSGAVRAVMGALDGIYDCRRHRPFKERYVLSAWLSVAVGACLVASFAVARFVPLALGNPPLLLAILAFVGRWLVAGFFMALAVGLLAHFAPGVRRPLPWVSFGTGVVIVGWVGMSIGFGIYLTKIADYQSIFGHLATVIVVMAYLYASSVVFLGGLQLDAIVRSQVRRRARERAAA